MYTYRGDRNTPQLDCLPYNILLTFTSKAQQNSYNITLLTHKLIINVEPE